LPLDGLPLDEITAYIGHHLPVAGPWEPPFSDEAIAPIHQICRGQPTGDR